MASARALTIATWIAALVQSAACFDVPASSSPAPESAQQAIFHRVSSPDCVESYLDCYSACETDEAACDVGEMSPLCTPNIARTSECQADCGRLYGCMPWDVGVESGLPCRWSEDRFDCNFAICSFAATECLLDCAEIFRTTNPLQELLYQCIERCYDHYGCRPRDSDPCNPLPEGHVYCGCPQEHGVECHAAEFASCSF